jgi:hypothetical protein
MKRITLLFICAIFLCSINYSYAQLSTRENDANVVLLGARPAAGDFALTFAYHIKDNKDTLSTLYGGNGLSAGDLLTFKYYLNDDLAIRFGFNLYRKSIHSEGSIINPDTLPGTLVSNKYKTSSRLYEFVPGIEKHFSASNIFDVYAAGDLYLGFGRDVKINNESYSKGDYMESTATTPTTVVGLGGVVGVNIFIAQMPISVGLEYGWSAKWKFGGKTEVKANSKIGNISSSQTYYTEKYDGLGNADNNEYSSLKRGEAYMNSNSSLRVVLNIYFGK